MLSGRLLVMTVLVLTAWLVACGESSRSERSASPARTQSPLPPDASGNASEGCDADFSFEPAFLPEGFDGEPRPGPAPSGAPPDTDDQAIVHYRGDGGQALEIRRPGTMFPELALSDESPTIEVLGERTPNFGPVEPGGERLIVQFTYTGPGEPRKDECSSYSLNEYGLDLPTLKQVAESLRPS